MLDEAADEGGFADACGGEIGGETWDDEHKGEEGRRGREGGGEGDGMNSGKEMGEQREEGGRGEEGRERTGEERDERAGEGREQEKGGRSMWTRGVTWRAMDEDHKWRGLIDSALDERGVHAALLALRLSRPSASRGTP